MSIGQWDDLGRGGESLGMACALKPTNRGWGCNPVGGVFAYPVWVLLPVVNTCNASPWVVEAGGSGVGNHFPLLSWVKASLVSVRLLPNKQKGQRDGLAGKGICPQALT